MAKMYVTEYGGIAPGELPAAILPPIVATYTVTVSSVAVTATQAIDTATVLVRLHTDAICSFNLVQTTTGAASATDARMAANTTEYFAPQKTGWHVSVITNT